MGTYAHAPAVTYAAQPVAASVAPVAGVYAHTYDPSVAYAQLYPAAEPYVHEEIEAEPYVHEEIAAEPYVHEEIAAEPYVHIEGAAAPVAVPAYTYAAAPVVHAAPVATYNYAAAPVAYASHPVVYGAHPFGLVPLCRLPLPSRASKPYTSCVYQGLWTSYRKEI